MACNLPRREWTKDGRSGFDHGCDSIPRLALDGLTGVNELADVPGLGKSGKSGGKKTRVIHGSELADPESFERVKNAALTMWGVTSSGI